MSYEISSAKLIRYDSGKTGIELPITLSFGSLGQDEIKIIAKLDTGSTDCIFQRFCGEERGLDIETGYRKDFSTATGIFTAYGHSVTLTVFGIDFEAMVYFAKAPEFNRNVLGRNGFLNRVLIALNDYAGNLYFTQNIEQDI